MSEALTKHLQLLPSNPIQEVHLLAGIEQWTAGLATLIAQIAL